MAGRYSVLILDRLGNYAPAVNGVLIPGPAIGVFNVRFTPTGGAIDKIPTLSFSVFLSIWRNLAIKPGAAIRLLDADLNQAVVGEFIVGARSMTVAQDGITANVTCYDQLDELRRVTVTSGFVTSPSETLNLTLQRLVAKQHETTWASTSDVGSAYDGLAFTTAQQSVAQAVAKLAGERFSHFKRSATRTLAFGHFGTVSGVTLGQGGQNPTRTAVENVAWRQILDGGLTVKTDGNIVNSLVPTGAGNGVAQLTLQPLYNATGETNLGNGVFQTGPITFVGYDGAAFPLRRRPSDNPGQTVDGKEYFIQDSTSIASYGEWWDGWQQQSIAPAGTTPADWVNAAQALYNASISHLKWNSTPHEEYTITTLGNADWRNLAGQTVRVVYRGIASTVEGTFVNLDLNTDLVLMEVLLSEAATGEVTATCTVSNLGKYAASNTSIVISAIQQVEYGHFTAQTYPGGYPMAFLGVADKDHPLIRTYPGNGGTTQVLEASISVYIVPATLPARPKFHGHDVVTAPTPHDVGRDTSGNATTVPHDVAANPSLQYKIGGAVVNGQVLDYDAAPLLVFSSNPPGAAKAVYTDGVNLYYNSPSGSILSVQLPTSHLSIFQTNATTNNTGGKVKSTSSGTGGVTQVKTHAYVQGTGGSADSFNTSFDGGGAAFDPATTGVGSGAQGEVGMEWGYFQNAAALPSVTVRIGGVIVGTVSGVGKIDITAAVIANGGAARDFDYSLTPGAASGNATGLCEMYGTIQTRTVVAAIGKSGGVI